MSVQATTAGENNRENESVVCVTDCTSFYRGLPLLMALSIVLFLFLSHILLTVLRSFPNRVFQAYAVPQSFHCVSNDYKIQLRLRSIEFSKSVVTRVRNPWPLISVLTWSNLKEGGKGQREGKRKGGSGQVSQNNHTCASLWYCCCHCKTQKAFWVAFPAT